MIQLVRVAHRSVLELNTYRPGGALCAAGNEHGAWIGLIDEESKLRILWKDLQEEFQALSD